MRRKVACQQLHSDPGQKKTIISQCRCPYCRNPLAALFSCCILPTSTPPSRRSQAMASKMLTFVTTGREMPEKRPAAGRRRDFAEIYARFDKSRSEERRVGKECRS